MTIWHSKNNTFLSAMALPETRKVKILQEIQHFFDVWWPPISARWPFGTAKTIHFRRRWPFLRLEKSKYCKKYNTFLIFGGLPYLPDNHLAQQKQYIFVGDGPSWDSKSQNTARNINIFDGSDVLMAIIPKKKQYICIAGHFGSLPFLRKYNTLAVWLVWLATSFLDPSRGVPPWIRRNGQFFLIDLNRNHNDFDRLDFLWFPPPWLDSPPRPLLAMFSKKK